MPFAPPKRCTIKCDIDESRCFLYQGHIAEHYFGNKKMRMLA